MNKNEAKRNERKQQTKQGQKNTKRTAANKIEAEIKKNYHNRT